MTGHAPLPYDFMPAVPSFELRSDDVADGQMMWRNQVLDGLGMTGGNISSSLSWSGFPAETKSFVVTLFDPDAPTGSGWWHWVVPAWPDAAFHVRGVESLASWPSSHGDMSARWRLSGEVRAG
jgi:hypothetical protein